jgi:hypothetical protein
LFEQREGTLRATASSCGVCRRPESRSGVGGPGANRCCDIESRGHAVVVSAAVRNRLEISGDVTCVGRRIGLSVEGDAGDDGRRPRMTICWSGEVPGEERRGALVAIALMLLACSSDMHCVTIPQKTALLCTEVVDASRASTL